MRGKFRFKANCALAMAIAAGMLVPGVAVVSAPAVAKGKASNSAAFVAAYKPAQEKIDSIEKGRASMSEAQLAAAANEALPLAQAAVSAASTDLDKLLGGQFLVTIGGWNGDMALRQRGAQMMIDSGQLKPEQLPQFQFYLGNFAYAAKDYATAARALKAASDLGFQDERLVPLMVQAYGEAGQTAEGLAAAKQAIASLTAAGRPVSEDLINRAMVVAYKAKMGPETIGFASSMVKLHPSNMNWLNAAQMVRSFSTFDPAASLDLARLLDRSGGLKNERQYVMPEYKEYVETADPRKNPGEVVRIIQMGKSNGVLNSGDTWATEALTNASARTAEDKASLAGLVRDAGSAGDGKTAMIAGDVAMNYGEAATAEKMYSTAVSKGGVDANVANTRLGIAQYDQGKYAEAAASFGKVTGARKPLADLWTILAQSKATPAAAPAAAPAS